MRSMRGVGVAAAAAVVVVLVAGCGGDDDGGGEKASKPAPSVVASASLGPRASVDEALAAYQRATAAGCTDAPSCQEQMTAELAAVKDLREALELEDAAAYAEPIRLLRRAERLADHYGRDNLAAKGNALAVNQPMQQAISWLAVNR